MNKTLVSAAMLAALLALGACDKKTDTTTAPADTMASTPSMAASDSVTTTPAPAMSSSDAASGSMGASSAP